MSNVFTHINADGNAHMVDVTEKAVTEREARAEAFIEMASTTLEMIMSGSHHKGDVFATARIAGIQAAKKTSDLIPLCHPLLLTSIKVELQADGEDCVLIRAACKLAGQVCEALAARAEAAFHQANCLLKQPHRKLWPAAAVCFVGAMAGGSLGKGAVDRSRVRTSALNCCSSDTGR